jgi:hypothetical protein
MFFLRVCLTAALSAHAFGGTVVVPNANATVAGGGTSGALPTPALSGVELQTVFGTDQFPAGPLYITGFTMRPVPGTGPLSFTVSGSIYLSTSPNYPNTNGGHTLMSTTFASNVGPDNTLVLSGTITSNGAGCTGPAACPFASNIVFTTPFLYDPANGPLLLDAKATSFGGTGQFDVVTCSAPGCSIAGIEGLLALPSALIFNYGGSVTQFTYTPVAFFTGQVPVGSGVDYLQFPDSNPFGYYNFVSNSIFYHYDMGYEAFIPGSAADTYLYDFATGHWLYTSSTLFPYLYDFTLKTWIYYFPDTKNPGHYTTNPRYFSNLTSGQIFTM